MSADTHIRAMPMMKMSFTFTVCLMIAVIVSTLVNGDSETTTDATLPHMKEVKYKVLNRLHIIVYEAKHMLKNHSCSCVDSLKSKTTRSLAVAELCDAFYEARDCLPDSHCVIKIQLDALVSIYKYGFDTSCSEFTNIPEDQRTNRFEELGNSEFDAATTPQDLLENVLFEAKAILNLYVGVCSCIESISGSFNSTSACRIYHLTKDCVLKSKCAGKDKLLKLFEQADRVNAMWCLNGTLLINPSGIESHTGANEPMPKAALICMFFLVVVFISSF